MHTINLVTKRREMFTIWHCSAQYMRNLYYLASEQALESPSWLCMLSQSEHEQPLDGWPQHILINKISGNVVTPGFSDLLYGELGALHGHKGYGRVCQKTKEGVVVCSYRLVCPGNNSGCRRVKRHRALRELMLSFGVDSLWGTYTASLVVSELL